MVSIFNRRELRITHSMEEAERIRTLLERQNIAYTVKSRNLLNPGRSRGMPGIRQDAAYLYRIFVRKSEYEKAEWALRQ